jgi:hypothetical protein
MSNKSDMPHGCFSSGVAPTAWGTRFLYFARQVGVMWDFNSFYFILFGSLVNLTNRYLHALPEQPATYCTGFQLL